MENWIGKGMRCESSQMIGLKYTCRKLRCYLGDHGKLLENFEHKEAQICIMKKPCMTTDVWINKESHSVVTCKVGW
jgi:hypothetical protein